MAHVDHWDRMQQAALAPRSRGTTRQLKGSRNRIPVHLVAQVVLKAMTRLDKRGDGIAPCTPPFPPWPDSVDIKRPLKVLTEGLSSYSVMKALLPAKSFKVPIERVTRRLRGP